MRFPPPQSAPQVLRLVAALLTVTVVLVLGAVSATEVREPAYDRYVSLGDSFTAAPYVPLTEVGDGCLRSIDNYPHLVAGALGIPELLDRSCTGAQTQDLAGSQTTLLGRRVPPQLDALDRRTDLVTLGIGANDDRLYGRIATRCRRMTGVCRLYDERAVIGGIIDRLGPSLVDTLGLIQERAPEARVLLIGYPKLLPQRGDCPRLPRMRPQDRATFRWANRGLVEQMRGAAEESDVEFVDFYSTSIGHDICSPDPWLQGRDGNGRLAAGMHPLAVGQLALARQIEDVLRRPPPD